MRHKKALTKLGRPHKERLALLKNLAVSVILHEKVSTTEAKAKTIRPVLEKLITKAKSGTLHDRRQLLSYLNNDENVVKKLMENIAPRYQDRNGGYVSLVKSENRKGDNAPMCYVMFI